MARAATTSDVFNAIAERRRREIIEALSVGKPMAVGELVLRLDLAQPAVSKHLGVLRKVGLVEVERSGQHRLYRLNAEPLKNVHQWVSHFERLWDAHLLAIKVAAERAARQKRTGK